MAISKGKILAKLCPTGSQPVTRARLRCGPEGAPWVLLFTGQLPGSWAEGSAGGGVTCGSPSPSSAPGTRSLWVLWEARLVARLCLDLTLPVKGFPVAPRPWPGHSSMSLGVLPSAPSCPTAPRGRGNHFHFSASQAVQRLLLQMNQYTSQHEALLRL